MFSYKYKTRLSRPIKTYRYVNIVIMFSDQKTSPVVKREKNQENILAAKKIIKINKTKKY
jgi:hypothetical protein